MWWYENVTRDDFETVKDLVEKIMLEAGAEIFEIVLPYKQKTTAFWGHHNETHFSERPVFTYNDEYFRVDEVLLKKKPFIVIEFGDKDQLMNNTMEDAEPFPYDLPYEELVKEVRYSLGIQPYPKL